MPTQETSDPFNDLIGDRFREWLYGDVLGSIPEAGDPSDTSPAIVLDIDSFDGSYYNPLDQTWYETAPDINTGQFNWGNPVSPERQVYLDTWRQAAIRNNQFIEEFGLNDPINNPNFLKIYPICGMQLGIQLLKI